MTTARGLGTVVLWAALAAGAPAAAVIVGGGGGASRDCLVVFDAPANHPAGTPRQVRCTDGDPACDADGAVNGVCSIPVAVCVNSTALAGCALSGVGTIQVEHAIDNGDPKFDPDFLALRSQIGMDLALPLATPDACTGAVIVRVPIKGPIGNNKCGRQRKKIRLFSASTPGPDGVVTDTDTLKLACAPDPLAGCDPQALYASTFDRIQKQIFNQSCALSACHDSQSQAGTLLLETGAALGNLIDQPSINGSAFDAGWPRVNAAQSDPATSFLFRKVSGDLPDASFGERMPRDARKLHRTLRDVLERWIGAGAPAGGWVPGTY